MRPDRGLHTPNSQLARLLKPTLRAYGIAYLSVAGPRLLRLLHGLSIRKVHKSNALEKFYQVLVTRSALASFPTFCGSLVGLYTILRVLLQVTFREIAPVIGIEERSRWNKTRSANLVAAFAASWISLQSLNKPKQYVVQESEQNTEAPAVLEKQRDGGKTSRAAIPSRSMPQAGKTIDLTLLVVVRAMDSFIGDLWSQHKSRRSRASKWTKIESLVSRMTDATVFAVSSGAVMWAWIYLPERLPQAYNDWIREAAQVDVRLVELLRSARKGQWVYGPGQKKSAGIQSMCEDYGWPISWADPSKTIPLPCECVHMGLGPSCHYHAASRFLQSFKFAFQMYFPLQVVLRLRQPSITAMTKAIKDAIRSSTFLGAFICLYYYSICLSRTLLGPKLFPRRLISPQQWDSGLCIGAGCVTCGWSILIEAARRRQEIALFVAPRAAATLFPRRYNFKYFWREQLAFALGVAVLFDFVNEKPHRIRGLVGRILYRVLR